MTSSIIYLASARKKHCILVWYGNKINLERVRGRKKGKTLRTVPKGSSDLAGSQKGPTQLMWHPHLVGLPQPDVKGWFPQSLDGLLGQHVLQTERQEL